MIRVASFIENRGGWARHSRAFAKALDRYERTELVDWSRIPRSGTPSRFREWLRCRSNSVGVSMGALERTFTLGTRYRVAFCIWETTVLPVPQVFVLKRADLVWTMSRWGREILEAHGVPAERIGIVPAGVDVESFRPPAGGRPPAEPFRFLCVGKWEERKGTALLVRAFAEEFDPSEPVELVLHCGTLGKREVDYRQETRAIVRESGRAGARIAFSDPTDDGRLIKLMQSCHGFVLPTRGEGWGLPILEAMACELPCIVTGYSGVTEFANEWNSYLVPVEKLVPVEDQEFYPPPNDYGVWAQPDVAQLRRLMRVVVEDPAGASAKARRAREDAERLWTWDMAARKAMANIAALRAAGRL